MFKLAVMLQAVIIILLAIVIALIVYYGTNPANPVKSHTITVRTAQLLSSHAA